MKKIMFGNFKGGVGKTVSSVSISHAMHLMNKKVLLIDADPQGNSSNWLEPNNVQFELADIINNKCPFHKSIVQTKQNFDMIITFPDGDLRNVSENQLTKKPFLFEDIFQSFSKNYDYLFIDTSPSFSPLERSICMAVDEVICPVELEFFAVDGLGQFDKNIKDLNQHWRKNTRFNKIILTKENKSYSRHKLLLELIKEKNNYQFFTVRQDAMIAESIGLNITIFQRDPKAKSAIDYLNCAKGVL